MSISSSPIGGFGNPYPSCHTMTSKIEVFLLENMSHRSNLPQNFLTRLNSSLKFPRIVQNPHFRASFPKFDIITKSYPNVNPTFCSGLCRSVRSKIRIIYSYLVLIHNFSKERRFRIHSLRTLSSLEAAISDFPSFSLVLRYFLQL